MDGLYYLGAYYQKIGDLQKAKMYYEESLDIDNEQSETHLDLGICCYKLSLFEEALNAFSYAYKYDSNCIEAIQNKALVYINMKNYEEALKEFFLFNDFEPYDIDTMIDIAHCYYKMGDTENSYVWCNKALSIDSQNDFNNKLLKILASESKLNDCTHKCNN